MYADVGRPSIPPERLLKASLLIGLFSVRSERAFCEELDDNLLFRWFLGMQLMERSFDPTVFTQERAAAAGASSGPADVRRVSADGKMSEIAEMKLTHQGGASSTEKPWRCERDVAKGGRRERDLRDERGGPFGAGDCPRVGYRSEHGAAVSELSGGDAAQATASAFLKAGRVRGVRGPSARRRVGQLRRASPGAA